MKAKLIKNIHGFLLWTSDKELQKILGCVEPDSKPYKLSLKNCEVIENGYDLYEIALEETKKFLGYDTPENKMIFITHSKMFQKGFQKALELLNNRKFTAGDVMLGWDAGVMSSGIVVSTEQLKPHREYYEKDLKPVLLQQTEWDVEICCHTANGEDSFTCNFTTNTGIPKLDSDGCLILRRI